MKKLLVIRFSAMGDVAMTVPVIHALATQHPELRITVMTRGRFAPMFQWMPANVEVKPVELEKYSGIFGLGRLYGELKQKRYDAVADLHDVLRTKYLRLRFKIIGKIVAVIDKGRKEKKALMGNGQTAEPLKPMFERYRDVFRQLGYDFALEYKHAINPHTENFSRINTSIGIKQQGDKWIGIAPFAAHEGKIYPLEQMKVVAENFAAKGCKVLLFGAGKKESEILHSWQGENITSTCGLLGGLYNEMLLMSRLDLMVAMDSANMHIASIVGTPALSVWGATHPKAGFLGWGQSDNNIVQLDIPCRPCSVYGNKPCQFGDYRCLKGITPDIIVEKGMKIISE
jgi:ADP-heptose:LPS heptosyltransferase